MAKLKFKANMPKTYTAHIQFVGEAKPIEFKLVNHSLFNKDGAVFLDFTLEDDTFTIVPLSNILYMSFDKDFTRLKELTEKENQNG